MFVDEKATPEPLIQPPIQRWQRDLLNAAQYLRDHGWCQHTEEAADGRVCLFGAVYKVTEDRQPWDRLARYFGGSKRAVRWNDRHWRTQEEVIAVLEECAR